MRSRDNDSRLRLEMLEDRCTPGSVLDLLGDPPLVPLGQSLVLLEAAAAGANSGGALLAGPTPAGVQVPFKGSLGGVVTRTTVDDHTDFVLVEATGTATHLGQFTLAVPHLVNLPTRTATGYYEFTAANGDKLIAPFTGQARPTATPGVISIVETATIDPARSTGRFAGTTGGFVVERLFDRVAGTTIGSFEGTISAPGR